MVRICDVAVAVASLILADLIEILLDFVNERSPDLAGRYLFGVVTASFFLFEKFLLDLEKLIWAYLLLLP